MGKTVSNESIVADSTKRIGAMRKYVKNAKTEIPIGGAFVKPATIIAVFQKGLDTQAAVTATRAAYKEALAARDGAEVRRSATDESLKAWVLNAYGADSAEAHEFGYSARKVTQPSAETRAKGVLLNRATRDARGTKGPKAKLSIKGTLSPSAAAVPANPQPVVAPAPAPAPVVHAAAAPATSAPTVTPPVNAPGAGGNA
jgi:hypothetical protein